MNNLSPAMLVLIRELAKKAIAEQRERKRNAKPVPRDRAQRSKRAA